MPTIFPLRHAGHGGKNCLPEAEVQTPALRKKFKIKSLSLINGFWKAQRQNCGSPETVMLQPARLTSTMNRILLIIILTFVLTSCITKTTADKDFNLPPTLENLADKDTLFIEACIHHHCGGEWGGCLEWNKIYRQPNGYGVTFINGMTVWNGDTIIDPKKTKTISKTLTDSDIKHVDDFLHQVNIFSDSLSLTSNGPNYYIIKTKNYKKTIVQDYDQWLHYQRLTDNIYK